MVVNTSHDKQSFPFAVSSYVVRHTKQIKISLSKFIGMTNARDKRISQNRIGMATIEEGDDDKLEEARVLLMSIRG